MNAEPKKAAEQPRPSLRKALKGAPQRLWRLIYLNWPWKLLALFLALCLWAGLITQDPTLTRERVFNDVAISVTGADTLRRNSGLIVLSGLEEDALSVRLHVNVPQREYNSVSASYYNPRVDLTRITGTGEQTLKINTTSTSTYGAVRAVTPETITVVVDEYVTNYRVPVSINQTGEYPEGYYGAAPTANPSVVALSGPKSLVDRITRICVDFDASLLAAKEGKVRTALPMRFLTASGEEVESSLLEETEGLTGSEFSSPLLGRIFDLLRSRAAEGLSTQLPALAGALEPEEMAHLAWVAEQPENLANSRRELADYIALIREEGLRRSGTDEEALLRAAQKRYQETKAYMEEKP